MRIPGDCTMKRALFFLAGVTAYSLLLLVIEVLES